MRGQIGEYIGRLRGAYSGFNRALNKVVIVGALAAVLLSARGGIAYSADKEERKKPISVSWNWKGGFDFLSYDVDLPKEMQTTNVPTGGGEDGLEGVTTNLMEGSDHWGGSDLCPKLGAEISAGSEYLRFFLGGEGRLNVCSFLDGIDEYEPLPGVGEAFTVFKPYAFTLIPYAGVEVRGKQFSIGAEVGAPYWGFDYRRGICIGDEETTLQDNSWSGFGTSFRIRASSFGNKGTLSLLFGKEYYDAKLGGRDTPVDAVVFSLEYLLPF